nr:unnamed protein product [Callosobruchus chinensis]
MKIFEKDGCKQFHVHALCTIKYQQGMRITFSEA